MKKKRLNLLPVRQGEGRNSILFCTVKLFFLWCLTIALPAGGFAQQQKVNLNLKDVSVKYLFDEIQKQTHMFFVFSAEQTDKLGKISVQAEDENLENVLNRVFDRSDFVFEFSNDLIIIKEKGKVGNNPQQQKKMITVTGKVTDEKGEPLPGATIFQKGMTFATTANVQGNYSIQFEEGKNIWLVFTFIGKTKQEIQFTGQEEINVTLKEDEVALEDVVVTGYANIRETSFTGSYTKVDRDELMKVSSGKVLDALQVFDPSLRIATNNIMGSDPNTLPELYLRGRSGVAGVSELDQFLAEDSGDVSKYSLTKNPNIPIFIMDGFEVSLEKVYDLDPYRIESMTILKDAAATAIYGSRAANGVIVIETVAPKPGQFLVNYNLNASLTSPDLTGYNMMNAREKLNAEVAGGLLDGSGVLGLSNISEGERIHDYVKKMNNILLGVDTYWLSKPLQTEFNHRHNVYIEGGAEALRLGLSLRYDKNGGVMKGSSRNKMGIGLTIEYRLKGLQIRNAFSYDKVKSVNSPYGTFSKYAQQQPYDSPTDPETGEYVKLLPEYLGRTSTSSRLNPLYEATLKNYSGGEYSDFTNNLSINWFITDHLHAKAQFAISYVDTHNRNFTDPNSGKYAESNSSLIDRGDLALTDQKTFNWNTNLYLVYTNQFNSHNITSSLGLNAKNNESEYKTNRYVGFPSGELNTPSYANRMRDKTTESDDHTRLVGMFLTTNYTYKDIYLADVSIRLDGSSEFGTESRFSTFWSVGGGLNVHKYEFMERNYPLISQLKLTANYGITGKASFPPYAARHTYQVVTDDWYKTGLGTYLYYMGNDNLKWERTKTLNLAANLSFRKNRYSVIFRWYDKKTVDLITDVGIASSSGFDNYKDNMGEVGNRGIELEVNLRLVDREKFKFTFFGNIAHNSNKLLKLTTSMQEYNNRIDDFYKGYSSFGSKDEDKKYAKPFMKYVVGGSLNAITGMRSLGINPGDGKEMYLKRDGTITYTWDSMENDILGDRDPNYQGAFGLNVFYKNFTLYTTFTYQWGGQMYNQTLVDKVENVNLYRSNADKRVLEDRWRKPGDVTKLKAIQDSNITTRPSSRFVEDNNILTFNSLSIGYDFDREKLKKVRLNMLKFQFNMKDIFTLSSIKQERGLSYPFARTFNFSVSAGF